MIRDLHVDSVDATFVCFNIDLDIGQIKHKEVYEAFAYEEEADDDEEEDEEQGIFGMSGLYQSEGGQ